MRGVRGPRARARKLRQPMQVLLISMPFGALDRPALGLSLLKAELVEAGHRVDVSYGFERFVRRIGIENYNWLTHEAPYTAFAGDWCFTEALYGPDAERDRGYVQDILLGEWALPRQDIHRLFAVRKQAGAFLDDYVAGIDLDRYDLVGFTSTFAQNIASLACAARIKSVSPGTPIVFGGANWEGVMGEALFASFPTVDFVCRGEADVSLPALAGSLETGEDLSSIPGLLYRDGVGGPAMQITDLDALPVPDLSDYFEMIERTAPDLEPTLLMETSRGCWWGAKSHCTFCGLNGQGMAFRSKSAARALSELRQLTSESSCQLVSMVDNILDMRYFADFIPALAEDPVGPMLFYETKANLSREQVALLARADIRTIQPGIESLSDHVLQLMRKGTSALRNVQLLRWCREAGVSVEWNILYGFPGETDADYDDMLTLIGSLSHLQAPSACGPIRFDRYAPYHGTPEAFGLKDMAPLEVFDYLYPEATRRLDEIACYFTADTSNCSLASPETVARIHDAVEAWRAATGTLRVRDDGRKLALFDSRRGRNVVYALAGTDRAIYLLCDRIRTPASIATELGKLGLGEYSAERVSRFLAQLVERELVLEAGQRYLALGLYDRFPDHWREQVTREALVEA